MDHWTLSMDVRVRKEPKDEPYLGPVDLVACQSWSCSNVQCMIMRLLSTVALNWYWHDLKNGDDIWECPFIQCESESSSIVTPISIWSCHDSSSYLRNSIRIRFPALLTIFNGPNSDGGALTFRCQMRFPGRGAMKDREYDDRKHGCYDQVLRDGRSDSFQSFRHGQSSIKVETSFGIYSTGCNDHHHWNNSQKSSELTPVPCLLLITHQWISELSSLSQFFSNWSRVLWAVYKVTFSLVSSFFW